MRNRTGIRLLSSLTRLVGPSRLFRLAGQPDIFPFYHVVSDESLPHIRHLYGYFGVEAFERDLDQLLSVWEPVSLQDYLASREGSEGGGRGRKPGKDGRKPLMLLSFDDGLAECHGIIAPLLKKKGIPALFFLNNNFIDNKGLMYRYRASLLVDHVLKDPAALDRAAGFLRVNQEQVVPLLLTVTHAQQVLLDHVAGELGYAFDAYLGEHPVYMSTSQIRELLQWGFDIGAHSMDHPNMERLSAEEVTGQVLESVLDLQERFLVPVTGFAFPFSSLGIPRSTITKLLGQGVTLFGISGIRETGHVRFIQRIDMEQMALPAADTLRIKLLRSLLRKMTGTQRMRS